MFYRAMMAGWRNIVALVICLFFADVHARPNVVEFAPPEPQCGYRVSIYVTVYDIIES